MKKFACLISFCLLFSAGQVFAEGGDNYIGLNITRGQYSEDYIDEDFNPIALVAKTGYLFNDYFAVEARLGVGVVDDEQDIYGYDVSVKLKYLMGIYGKGILNLNEQFDVYAMLGFTKAEMEAELEGYSDSSDDSDLSFGIGVDYKLSNQLYLDFEYMSYMSKSDFDASAIAIGITKNF